MPSAFLSQLQQISSSLGIFSVLLLIILLYFLLILALNLCLSFKKTKTARNSFYLERFISTNAELLPYLSENEKLLMEQTLKNTLRNQKTAEIEEEKLNVAGFSQKIKKNKTVKIAEKLNSYHYINVKGEII